MPGHDCAQSWTSNLYMVPQKTAEAASALTGGAVALTAQQTTARGVPRTTADTHKSLTSRAGPLEALRTGVVTTAAGVVTAAAALGTHMTIAAPSTGSTTTAAADRTPAPPQTTGGTVHLPAAAVNQARMPRRTSTAAPVALTAAGGRTAQLAQPSTAGAHPKNTQRTQTDGGPTKTTAAA